MVALDNLSLNIVSIHLETLSLHLTQILSRDMRTDVLGVNAKTVKIQIRNQMYTA